MRDETDQRAAAATTFDRRQVLQLSGGVSAAIGMALLPGELAQAAPRGEYPFTLGVASGDPAPDGFVLWTRLAPHPLRSHTGMPDRAVSVDWEVATDEAMKHVVRSGTAYAPAQLAHSVHVEVEGLKPRPLVLVPVPRRRREQPRSAARRRSRAGRSAPTSCGSPSPRARTTSTGYYTAYEHMAEDDLDLVVPPRRLHLRVRDEPPAGPEASRCPTGRQRDQDAARLPHPPRAVQDRPAISRRRTPAAPGS